MAKKKKDTVDFSKARKKANTVKILKKLRIPIAVLLIIIIAAAGFIAAGETRCSNILDSFRAIPSTMGDSAGYPYNEDELSLEKVMLIGDKPMLISESGVQVLSQDADILQEIYPDWAGTRAISKNGRAVIYSNTSGKSYLISRTGTLASFSEDGTVVTADVGKNGCVAESVTTDKTQSVIKVYSPRQKTRFQWNCSKDYVSSLSLSDKGNKVLISAVGVDNAQIYSRVILYKTSKTEPQFDVKLEGTTVLKVVYASFRKMVAIGDNKTVFFNGKGEKTGEIDYADDALFAVDTDSDGNTLLCFKEYGGSKIKLVRIPSVGTLDWFEIDYTPSSVDFRGSRIALALDNEVTLYSPSGNQKKTYACKGNVSTALLTSSGLYTLESGTIYKYD